MGSKVREILKQCFRIVEKEGSDGLPEFTDTYNYDKAEAEILKEIEGCVPDKSICEFPGESDDVYRAIWDDCRSEMLKRIEELKGESDEKEKEKEL